MDFKLLSIDDIGMSVRCTNALHRIGVNTVADMFEYNEDKLRSVRNLGEKSIAEILEKIEYYSNFKGASAEETDDSDFTTEYFAFNKIKTEALELLSAKTYNRLVFGGYDTLDKFIFMSEGELMRIDDIDEPSAKEIIRECKRYLRANEAEIKAFGEKKKLETDKMSVYDIPYSDHRERVLRYVRANDVNVREMGISTRPLNRLINAGCFNMSDIIFFTEGDVEKLGGLGINSVNEILNAINKYRINHNDRLSAYLDGDDSALIEEETIENGIVDIYRSMGFSGLNLDEISKRLEELKGVEISYDRIKKVLGKLVAEKFLEYVDYRCYKIYPEFKEYYKKCTSVSDREKEMLEGRFSGMTLDEIGSRFSITRERTRQVLKKACEKIKKEYSEKTRDDLFDEDYYRYLYETYEFDHKDASPWLGVTDALWIYLEMTDSKKGKADLNLAIKDTENLEAGLRLRIKNYINRNKLYIDGKWVEKKRAELEIIVAKKYCADDTTYTMFTDIFNGFLEKEDIPYDESIYYTEGVIPTRRNRLQENRYILWKIGEKFRYYDIDGKDYTELLETLALENYDNIEISTLKFINDYPDIMAKYDIRDAYELHNLLKKITDGKHYASYPKLTFSKMPSLRFGTPDRDSDIFDVMVDNAPVTMEKICDIIYEKFGYDKRVIPTYMQCIMPYYYNGEFKIDYKCMPEERRTEFKKVLTDDFYSFDKLKKIYAKEFPDADTEEVNTYNLKLMGFITNSSYAVQNYHTANEYIIAQLTKDDTFDITPLRNRFADYGVYYQAFSDLKKNWDIIEYSADKFINIRKLNASGVTKRDIADFCDAVYEAAAGCDYFSIGSLRKNGFEHDMFDLGFEDFFYGSLLMSDERFSGQKFWGTMVFRRDKSAISTRSFVETIIKNEYRIDLYELEAFLKDEYGCVNVNAQDIVYKLSNADIFYDKELQIFYADQELYYREIDEIGGW